MKKAMVFLAVIFITFVPLQVLAGLPGMVWVYIDDPGVFGHEGFTGYMSKYETTNAQYCQFLNAALASGDVVVDGSYVEGADGSNSGADFVGLLYYNLAGPGYNYNGATNGGAARINYSGGSFTVDSGFDNHPVTYVSWYGSTAFCNYYGYRLPTEWEWQAVADYNGSYTYGCGTSINNSIANYYNSTHPDGTTIVGSFGTYGYGMCDMAGNVWEWTSSCYYAGCAPHYRVVRGGCWINSDNDCTVSIRNYYCHPYYTSIHIGFRVVLDSPFSVYLMATNNWDGKTINLSWSGGAGSVKIYKKKESGSFQYITTVSGSSYTDTIPELGKHYSYVLRNTSGTTISNEATVKAEVIVVLVRGESYKKSSSFYPDYWKPEGHAELVDVNEWFEDNSITCWVPPQGLGLGEGLSGWKDIYWNADELATFIDIKRVGQYQNAKINLVCHSAGGLIARHYVKKNPDIVKNIFCIQTPHTGNTVVNGTEACFLIPGNPANTYLTTLWLAGFNLTHRKANLGETRLYSLWSANYKDVYNSKLLKLGYYLTLADPLFKYIGDQPGSPVPGSGKSDGLTPAFSAQGYVNIPIDISLWVIKQIVSIDEDKLANSNLDHYSCHRHPDTLGKIMDWMGLPYTEGAGQSMGMVLAQSESSEPNIAPVYYVAGFTGDLNSLADVNETVSIGDSNSAYFRAIASDANYSFWLRDPCGLTYDPCYATSEPNVTYESEDEIFLYEVNSPIPGTWTLNLSTTVAPPNSVEYGLTVFESENIALFSYSNPSWVNTDANILIVAILTENDNPIMDANVIADVALTDVNSWLLTLYDDGVHNDANANDGIYANIFTSTTNIGTYNCQVRATGLSSLGTNFERTSSLSLTVSSPDVNFAGDINDIGIDLNTNGLYDILRFTIPVDVCEPNNYLLTASLSDSNDNLIKLLSTGSLTLPAGPNTLTLEVTAEDIVTHDANGPYKLSDIIISDANTGLTIAKAIDYNTGAYVVADFEQLDTDGDGLSDNFELSIGSDINLPDSDYDGVTDYNEVGYDGDANSYNVATDLNSLNSDTDGDGMDDGWEINFGFDPLVDDGAKNNDDDADGLLNLEEFQNSTLPDNPDTDSDGLVDGNEISLYGTNPTRLCLKTQSLDIFVS